MNARVIAFRPEATSGTPSQAVNARTPARATPQFICLPAEEAALAAHQEAQNALSMALYHLQTSASNIPGATRKAHQALAALHRLQATGVAQ